MIYILLITNSTLLYNGSCLYENYVLYDIACGYNDYSYSYLFKLAKWHNAQLSHAYNTLNYLNRVLYSHNPPLAFKETMSILFVDHKPFYNPNSQIEYERKLALRNFKLGKAPYVVINTVVRSKKFFPYNLPEFFKRVPNYILSLVPTSQILL